MVALRRINTVRSLAPMNRLIFQSVVGWLLVASYDRQGTGQIPLARPGPDQIRLAENPGRRQVRTQTRRSLSQACARPGRGPGRRHHTWTDQVCDQKKYKVHEEVRWSGRVVSKFHYTDTNQITEKSAITSPQPEKARKSLRPTYQADLSETIGRRPGATWSKTSRANGIWP
jgi:hypothetical protein